MCFDRCLLCSSENVSLFTFFQSNIAWQKQIKIEHRKLQSNKIEFEMWCHCTLPWISLANCCQCRLFQFIKSYAFIPMFDYYIYRKPKEKSFFFNLYKSNIYFEHINKYEEDMRWNNRKTRKSVLLSLG